jgi:transcriptional regulator GlxA family with amidase domain
MFSPQVGPHTPPAPIEPGVSDARTVPHARQSSARTDLVARAVKLLHDHVNEPLTMTELSRHAGVSERTLRAAFHDVLGVSPKQYAIGHRLRAAREALCAADPDTTTVTDVATAYGFFELGRFAGRYRDAFGEVPSRTLQLAAARWTREAA